MALVIEVSGDVGEGKTTLMRLVRNALQSAGVPVGVECPDDDIDHGAVLHREVAVIKRMKAANESVRLCEVYRNRAFC